ncbi:MAG: hypothetical protein ACRDRY_13975 [Pseudonocardiaceae bacterium]
MAAPATGGLLCAQARNSRKVAGLGSRDLRALLLGRGVGPDRGDPLPAIEHRPGRGEVKLGTGAAQCLGVFGLELRSLIGCELG